MKHFKLFLAIALVFGVATTASAQFVSGAADSKSSSANTDAWDRVFVSYNMISAEDIDLDGFSFGYSHGFSISKNAPLFLEVAPFVTYGFGDTIVGTTGGDVVPGDISYLGLNVPINLTYKWAVNQSDFSLVPFVGINLRGNLIAKATSDYASGELDFFDAYDAKRFQFGGQIGLGMNYKKLYVGLGYTFDISEFAEQTKISMFNISVGLNF